MPETSVMVPCAQNIHVCVLPLQVFGRVVDPENFADQAYLTMNAWQIELADSRIGCLRLFSPDNPTGRKFTSYQFTVRGGSLTYPAYVTALLLFACFWFDAQPPPN
jgi:hypothetical protein